MKRTVVASALILLLLAGGASARQNSNTRSAKKGNTNAAAKKPAVDCSKTTDDQITAAVKDKLAKTNSLKTFKIDVATSGGVVTLTGKVKNGGLKGVATNQAKRASPCVKKVDNKCEVESHAAPKAGNKNTAQKAAKNKNTK